MLCQMYVYIDDHVEGVFKVKVKVMSKVKGHFKVIGPLQVKRSFKRSNVTL